jgi:formate dehydrogenase gamma subunit
MIRRTAALTFCGLLLAAGLAQGAANALVEVAHKKPYVHRIRLRDEKGDFITPDSTVPYSPRQTCGECHNYETIAGGMHFDMGASRLSDDFGTDAGKPWVLSDGMVGGWLPSFRRQYAKKKNASADPIDLTAFEFVRACGPCHPGGGALEHDRDGQRYDLRMAKTPKLADSLDGDYHQAKWEKTGVVEIDCLLCHAQWDYNFQERLVQLRNHNYRYAATAAAGLGVVNGQALADASAEDGEVDPAAPGASFYGDEPAEVTVAYHSRHFDGQNHVTLDIESPPDRACLSCHHFPAREGTSGRDRRHWVDVHTAQGMKCVDCHYGGLSHDFELGHPIYEKQPLAKGSAEQGSGDSEEGGGPAKTPQEAERDPDDRPAKEPEFHLAPHARAEDSPHIAPMTCRDCHERGLMGATQAQHVGLPEFHLDRIACVTCHVGPALGHHGEAIVYADPAPSTPEGAELAIPYPDQQSHWQVWYSKVDGQIRVQNCMPPYWWGNRMQGDEHEEGEHLWPYFPSEMAAAWKLCGADIQDDDQNGVPEVNTRDEIRSMDAALKQVLKGGRFETIRPVYIKGDTAHWVHEEEIVVVEGHADTEPQRVNLAHAVLGPQQSLGADGCTDCHARDDYFFGGDRVMCYLTYYNYPHTRSMRRDMDYESRSVRYSALREGTVKPYGWVLIPLVVVLCLIHYVVFGPTRVHHEDRDDEVQRFSLFERLMHLVGLLTFLVLAVSGLGFIGSALVGDEASPLWSSPAMVTLHEVCGYVFIAFTVVMIVRWTTAATFKDHDVQWFRVLGGYLWMKGKAPAGKFNAGQKALFWFLAFAAVLLGLTGLAMIFEPPALRGYLALACLIHDVAAVLMIPAIFGHVYLGTVCNPGTLRAMFEGKVTRAWARHHHPLWADELEEANSSDTAES